MVDAILVAYWIVFEMKFRNVEDSLECSGNDCQLWFNLYCLPRGSSVTSREKCEVSEEGGYLRQWMHWREDWIRARYRRY